MADLEALAVAVASSRKYRTLCEDTIRRVAAQQLAAAPSASLKAAVKATRRRLHQAYGAFQQAQGVEDAFHGLEVAYQSGSAAEVEAACRRVLALHQSTRERLPVVDEFYRRVWALTGRPHTLLDLGCGLNPLALPWMGLGPGARYIAIDIDRQRVEWLNRYLVLAGLEPLARCQDVLAHTPADAADVALLLKTAPTLERQEPGSVARLIAALGPPHVVVSFAVKSLGGREKGMVANYERQFHELAARSGYGSSSLETVRFESELVFIVHK